VANDENLPNELTERFEIHQELARGATGRLFQAVETSSGRHGVLKVIHPEITASASDRQRLKRELVKQATLSHDNLVLPIATGEAEKTLWLFRESLAGETLRERIDADGTFVASEALQVVAQIAAGLDELHRAGLLYRDLKPSHVLFEDDGSVVCFDAGLAAPVASEEVFELHGTPAYLSPEQCKGRLVSFRSDLYALGCILHEMMTGKPPFEADDVDALLKAHVENDPPAASEKLPEPAQKLVAQLLEKDPRQRPFSAQQVRRALDPFVPEELRSGPGGIRSATLTGMPAVSSPSGPPRPPSLSQPPRPPSMNPPEPKEAEAKPERPAGTTPRTPDATQQVHLDQIIEETGSKPPAPPSVSKPPAPPTSQPPAPPTSQPPAPPSASKPPAPPTSQPPSQPAEAQPPEDRSSAPLPPAPKPPERPSAPEAAKPKSADTTQPLDALDIVDEQPIAAPVVAAAAASPAEAQHHQVPSEPEPAGAAVDGLDFDEDAETIAREAPQGLAGMTALDPQTAGTQNAPAATQPDPSMQQPSVQVQPQQHAAQQHVPQQHAAQQHAAQQPSYAGNEPAPVTAQPAQGGGKGAMLFFGGAAMLFLTAVVIVGGFIFASGDDEEVAAVTPPEPTPPVASPSPPAQTPAITTVEATTPEPTEVVEPETTEATETETEAETTETEAETTETEAETTETETEATETETTETETRTEPSMRTTMRSSMRATMSSGNSFDAIREQAGDAFRAGNFRGAAQLYQRATAVNPRHAGSYAGLGNARMQLRDFRGAVQAFTRAVQLNPRSSGFLTSLGHAHAASGNRAAARQAYQRAIAINPNNRGAQAGLSRL